MNPSSDAAEQLATSSFYENNLAAFHTQVTDHQIAQQFLSGEGIKLDGKVLEAADVIALPPPLGQVTTLQLAHLFSIFNNSRVHEQAQNFYGLDSAPPGLYFTVVNTKLLQDKNRSGIFEEDSENAVLFIQGLHIDHFFLKKDKRGLNLGTVAIALCALASYQVGLKSISLVAAGGKGYHPNHKGFLMWPKVGFDANLLPGEVNGEPHLQHCQTVQDVLAADPAWWTINGSQRLMRFDLAPHSRSWGKLVTYVTENVLAEVQNGN